MIGVLSRDVTEQHRARYVSAVCNRETIKGFHDNLNRNRKC